MDLRAEAPPAMVDVLLSDDPLPALDAPFQALLAHVDKVTLAPATCSRRDIEVLRGHGLTDEQIHAAVQTAAYFAYINRVADALGVDLEPEMTE